MRFENLELHNFRNFREICLSLSPSINIFLGQNGQGKTNLLESIHFLTRGQSFRPGSGENFIRQEALAENGISLVRGNIYKKNLKNQIEFILGKKTKKVLIDKKKQSAAELGKNFPSVLFSPESLSAIKEGPEQRRLLVDEFLVSHNPENIQLLHHYKKCLKSRNKLLKSRLNERISPIEFEKTLESLNPNFFLFSTHLVLARTNALRVLLPKIQEAMRFILNDKKVEISVDYIISDESALNWSHDEVFKSLVDRGQQLSAAERSLGVSLVGPQKHDIRFLFNGNDSRYYCSQGQQRALILSYKMAQIVYYYEACNCYPILLLDDVMSELDAEKRDRLVQLLKSVEAQIFVTTTDFELSRVLDDSQLSVFKIEKGSINKVV